MATRVHSLLIRTAGISCICRAQPQVPTGPGAGGGGGARDKLNPMGDARVWDETVALYNNPDNHYAPFTDGDRLNGGRK